MYRFAVRVVPTALAGLLGLLAAVGCEQGGPDESPVARERRTHDAPPATLDPAREAVRVYFRGKVPGGKFDEVRWWPSRRADG